MRIPGDLYALLIKFEKKFSLPVGENEIREWTLKFIQQAIFQFPNEGYGSKRASATRPLSKDVIAKQNPVGQDVTFLGWDIVIGAGTDTPKLTGPNAESFDLTTPQVFVPLTPVNWLSDVIPDPEPEPEPEPIPDCCDEVRKAIVVILNKLETLENKLDTYQAMTINRLNELSSELQAAKVEILAQKKCKLPW